MPRGSTRGILQPLKMSRRGGIDTEKNHWFVLLGQGSLPLSKPDHSYVQPRNHGHN